MQTSRRNLLRLVSCAGLALLATRFSAAQAPKIDQVLQQLEKVRSFSGVSISPDGRWVAWIESNGDGSGTSASVLEWQRAGAKPKRVAAPEATDQASVSDISWSPDSRRLAFLSSGTSSQDQIFVMPVGGPAHEITNLDGHVTDLRWSTNGETIAFLYAEHGGGGGPLEAVPAQTGAIGSDIHNQRISEVSASGGPTRQLTPANLNIYEYDWSSDQKQFAAIAAPGPADNNWWIAKLYTVNSASGEMKLIYEPPVQRQLAVPRWSPDGKKIAFIGGLMSDQGFDGGDIFMLSLKDGQARNATPGIKASPGGLEWRSNDRILFTAAIEGGGEIATLDTNSGETEVLWKGGQDLHADGNYPNLAFAKDGRTSAAIQSSWEAAPEVTAGPIGEWKALTQSNASQRPQWGKAESLTWNSQGAKVQGWLLYPANFDAGKKYPMVVEIHGGPSGLKSASWPSAHFDMSAMAALGYFVFFPNPRGSYGEGEEFTRANVKDFGGGDLRDVLAGLDTVLKKVPVDERRIGVTGWSYGGFMTMWTVTQTDRFRAAVAGAGIANWLSYYGENSIDEWMKPFFGASVYDDPQVYAKSSPITYIKQVKTSTLVVVGERDGECPAPQSFEFWHALKTVGVPTELVVYAGEGHSFRDPKNRVDVMRRTLGWFDKYLK